MGSIDNKKYKENVDLLQGLLIFSTAQMCCARMTVKQSSHGQHPHNFANCSYMIYSPPEICIKIHPYVWSNVVNKQTNACNNYVIGGNNTALVQLMAWRRKGDKPLPEPIMDEFTVAYMPH